MKNITNIRGFLIVAAGAFTIISLSGCNESSLREIDIEEQKDQSTPNLLNHEPSNAGETAVNNTIDNKKSLQRGYAVTTDDPNLTFLVHNNAAGRYYLTKEEANAYVSVAGEKPIRLKGSSFLLMPDVTPVLSKQSENLYLQLNQGLNANIERQLAANSVRLDNYVGNNTWVVNLNQVQVDQLAGEDFVYAIGKKDLKDKVSPEILANGVYERSESGDYQLLVGLY